MIPAYVLHRFSSHRFTHIARHTLLLLINLSLLTSALVAQVETEPPTLEQGKPIERELAGDAAHSYNIALTSNQYLYVVVEQKGIDVVVRLFAPDGKQLVEVDSPNGSVGPEPVSLIVTIAGNYRLEVRSLEAKAEAGRYQVRLEELRASNPQDKSRIAAQQALSEGAGFESEGSAQSLRNAINKYQEALPLLRDAKDPAKEAETLTQIGSIYRRIGEKQKALDYLRQALPLRRAIGDYSGEASTLYNIGVVYNSLGEKQKALDYYNQALPLARKAGNHSYEANTLSDIGAVYQSLGENQKALDYLNKALTLRRAGGDRNGEAYTLNNIGVVYFSLGEKQKVLDVYNQALLLWRAGGDRRSEATTLSNMGAVYESLGEKQKALDFYNQALPIKRAVGDRSGQANTLSNIGVVYYSLGEKQKALDFYNLALPLWRAVGDRDGEAYTLSNIGAVYRSLDENKKALDFYNQALPIWHSVSNRRGEASTLNNIGVAYESLSEKLKALDFYNQTLTLWRAVGDRGGEAYTLANIARVERDRGNLTEARARIEDALTIFDTLRTKIASQELRSSYFATVQKFYDFYIDLLMRMHKQQPSAGHDGAALQASERGRARSLLETLNEAGADIRQGVDPTLVAHERLLQQQFNAKAQTQMKLLGGPHTEAQAQTMAKEIEALTTEYQQIEAEIRQKSPNYAALTQPEPLSLKEIQTKVLDQDTLLLEYSLGDERSYLWAVTPNSITSYELPGRIEIEALARQFYALLTDAERWNMPGTAGKSQMTMKGEAQSASSLDVANRLSQMLIAPVASELGKKRLLIVADGALQYISFGALPAPILNDARKQAKTYRPLVIDHEIVTLPSASTLAVLRQQVKNRKPALKTVAVVADPVFESSDKRVSRAINKTLATSPNGASRAETRNLPPGLLRSAEESGLKDAELEIPRLPGTRAEARQILSLVPRAQRKRAFDFAANRKVAMSRDLSQYRFVHFATHGFLNSVHPELSGLIFSMVDKKGDPQDGFLRAHEIFNLNLPAELVVLSACQTGLGKEIKGEGLVGLTRGFMYAGAPRVVVSLWSVSDEATAELMTRFYRGMLKGKLRPAAALRAAQVSLMRETRWRSPFYWAAFTLQGEWK